MNRIVLFFALLILYSTTATADDEFVYKEVTTPIHSPVVGTGVPFIATKARSRAEILYTSSKIDITWGDFITQLVYKGNNPGESFVRHFTVWMSNTWKRNFDHPQEAMTKVFDGDCTVAAGGSEDDCIPLLTITLDQPFEYKKEGIASGNVRVVIESSGEPTAQDVFFKQDKSDGLISRYSTADDDSGQWSEKVLSPFPLTILTVVTPVVYLKGTVTNQDKVPIPNAAIQLRSDDVLNPTVYYTGETDNEGNYAIRIDEGNKKYQATVSAAGCATYTENTRSTAVKEKPTLDFTLYDAVEYKAGRCATIIMPVTPDASLGKYFKLSGTTEDRHVVLERELSPQANIPYVIFPDRDFVVDLKSMDLTMEAGKVSIPDVNFVGSYINYDFYLWGDEKLIFLDETPDGGYLYSDLFGVHEVDGGRIAALRACIRAEWRYADDVIFRDETNGILPTVDKPYDSIIYDLQGRRLTTQPTKGIYIQNGKKVVIK